LIQRSFICMPAHCVLNIVCKSSKTYMTRSRECDFFLHPVYCGNYHKLPHSINLLSMSICEKITILVCSFHCTKFIILLINTSVHIWEFRMCYIRRKKYIVLNIRKSLLKLFFFSVWILNSTVIFIGNVTKIISSSYLM
jgi:hypothetical protein